MTHLCASASQLGCQFCFFVFKVPTMDDEALITPSGGGGYTEHREAEGPGRPDNNPPLNAPLGEDQLQGAPETVTVCVARPSGNEMLFEVVGTQEVVDLKHEIAERLGMDQGVPFR